MVPGLGIPILVMFALPGEGPQILEKALWLLAFVPLVFLSPWPWQWTERQSRSSWKRALPLSLVGGGLVGILLTAGVLVLAYPPDAFSVLFSRRLPVSAPLLVVLTVGLGWPMANLERLWTKVRAADAEARAMAWMRNRSPFPPDLLVSHLRHLSTQAESLPAETVDGILLLAQLYRSWLGMMECPLVALGTEQELVETYLEAEKQRSGVTILRRWHGFRETSGWRFPPFCLFSLCASILAKGSPVLDFSATETPDGLEVRVRQAGAFDEILVSGTLAKLREALGEQACCIPEGPSSLCLFVPRAGP